MRNIFLEKSYTKWVEKLFPDLFLKNQTWAYLWINSLKFYTTCFYCMPSWWLSKYNETKLQKVFLNDKKRPGTSLPASFSECLKKNIPLVRFYCLTKFHCLIAITLWDIGKNAYYNCLLAFCILLTKLLLMEYFFSDTL